MTLTIRGSARIAGFSATLFLAACGGGGGGGDSSPPPASTTSSVTASNVQDVSAEGVSAAGSLHDQINGGTGLVSGVTVDTASAGLVDVTLRRLYGALGSQGGAGLVSGAAVSETVSCLEGGSMTVAADIASDQHLSAGDTLTLTANNCKEDGATLNGKLAFRFNSISGTPGQTSAWSGELGTTFTNFSIATGGETESVNGDMLLKVTQTSFSSVSYVVSGSKLVTGTTGSGATVTRTISDYSYTGSEQSGVQTFNANFTFAGTLPKLGTVSYSVKTLADFKQQGTAYPYQGSLVITGSDKSSVTVTAVDSTSVTLGLDQNGDGSIDSTTTTTWAALDALN